MKRSATSITYDADHYAALLRALVAALAAEYPLTFTIVEVLESAAYNSPVSPGDLDVARSHFGDLTLGDYTGDSAS